MKKYNGKEIFEMLYDEIITEDQCLKVIHPEEEQYAISNNTYNDYTWRTFKIYLFERMLSRINEIIKCEERDNFSNYNGNYTISNKRFVKEVRGYLTMSIADFPSYLRQNNLLKNCEEW